ncbi:CubicO group peptidase, beta-lactamase class C family [Streptomyces sp. DvalAA-14]|uniref:serine hydrolase domain-containing protein n=1 Tax=unclassified Streptomyces TaxID=2593676 RepID=UPI00081B6A99|nr:MULTISPECIES: serine hydrolase domain-containing protein [unclassified Streptomyces]MYS23351.1 serine hydrolase [Streptomyces sp. SID4948]SCE32000.1 CubicO group peptidase, beta-lactamase class C family [Streptomyces sp. DvalAA-14]
MPPARDRARLPPGRLETVARAAGRRAGLVVAAYAAGESTTLCRGFTDRGGTLPVTDRTRFELGSVTKTFTSLLLADLAARGPVCLDEPLGALIPRRSLPRSPLAADITLEQLATHTSGLPRLPPGLLRTAAPSWTTNPYQAFPPEALLDSLAVSRLGHPPGTRVHYSNFGVGLLGALLTEQAGTGYDALLRAHVLEPLALTDTTADPAGPQATGHWHGRPRPPFLIPSMPAAGALRSSARDLLRYLRGLIAPHTVTPPGQPLHLALHEVTRPRRRALAGPELALAWTRRVRPAPAPALYFHSGATRGFTAFAGFSRDPAVAVVALTNTAPGLHSRFVQTAYQLLCDLAREPGGRPR